jgi:hypothetical protein
MIHPLTLLLSSEGRVEGEGYGSWLSLGENAYTSKKIIDKSV